MSAFPYGTIDSPAMLQQKIEELLATNAELVLKNEELENIIAIASHDLRSPLVNIHRFSQRQEKLMGFLLNRLACSDVPDAVRADLASMLHEEIPTAHTFIQSSTRKMDSLINGLLRISRAGRTQLQKQTIDVNEMVQQIINAMTIQLEAAAARITVDPLPTCYGDIGQINQVFTNLLDNAMKYRSPERPLVITLSGSVTENGALYVVADNGIGIAKEHHAKIWLPFHQLNPRHAQGGDGIGLSLVRRILDRHRSRIWVESRENAGSRFFVEIQQTPQGGI
ncbi:sensor histidine kinase [Chrysiogenes arsenatis]|uniref:sensor histidine kinase n=1 Tax=Chrysiogenes arsenatis TaxID=309797 RepID=UPI00041BE730|nr:ATP-binding protein [Chrysiogenes arsenatis]